MLCLTWHSVATARASKVFPLPGGPNSKSPRAGDRRPVNSSGRSDGKITISCNACFADSCPTISSHCTACPPSTISSKILWASFGSTPRNVADLPLPALVVAKNIRQIRTATVWCVGLPVTGGVVVASAGFPCRRVDNGSGN